MPRNPKGEMTVSEIRNLAKEINDKLKIKNIAQTSRAMLIKQIEARGYTLDHPNKQLVRGKGKVPKAPREKTITVKKQMKPKRGVSRTDVITGKISLGTGKKPVLSTPPKKKMPVKPKKKRTQYDEV